MKVVALILFTAALGLSSVTSANADTLSTIARRYGIDLDRLIAANPGVNPDRIHSDQPIVIPHSGSDGRARTVTLESSTSRRVASERYTVQAGDTLSAIARRLRTSPERIMNLNRLRDPQSIRIGQELRVPVASSRTASPAAKFTKTSRSTTSSGSSASGRGRVGRSNVDRPAGTPPAGRRPRTPVIIITTPKPVVSHG